jgi:hypothetical protein
MRVANLADLGGQLLVNGWIVASEPLVDLQDVPGRVHDGGTGGPGDACGRAAGAITTSFTQ